MLVVKTEGPPCPEVVTSTIACCMDTRALRRFSQLSGFFAIPCAIDCAAASRLPAGTWRGHHEPHDGRIK